MSPSDETVMKLLQLCFNVRFVCFRNFDELFGGLIIVWIAIGVELSRQHVIFLLDFLGGGALSFPHTPPWIHTPPSMHVMSVSPAPRG